LFCLLIYIDYTANDESQYQMVFEKIFVHGKFLKLKKCFFCYQILRNLALFNILFFRTFPKSPLNFDTTIERRVSCLIYFLRVIFLFYFVTSDIFTVTRVFNNL